MISGAGLARARDVDAAAAAARRSSSASDISSSLSLPAPTLKSTQLSQASAGRERQSNLAPARVTCTYLCFTSSSEIATFSQSSMTGTTAKGNVLYQETQYSVVDPYEVSKMQDRGRGERSGPGSCVGARSGSGLTRTLARGKGCWGSSLMLCQAPSQPGSRHCPSGDTSTSITSGRSCTTVPSQALNCTICICSIPFRVYELPTFCKQ